MRSDGVVVEAPGFDDSLGIDHADKPVLVQALIAKLAVEAFDVRVLDRFAWSNEAERDATAICPRVERSAREFTRGCLYNPILSW